MAQQETTFQTSNSWTTKIPTLNLSPTPFSVTFNWQGQYITVQLESGEDVLKLAQLFSDFLSSNGIPNKVINK